MRIRQSVRTFQNFPVFNLFIHGRDVKLIVALAQNVPPERDAHGGNVLIIDLLESEIAKKIPKKPEKFETFQKFQVFGDRPPEKCHVPNPPS